MPRRWPTFRDPPGDDETPVLDEAAALRARLRWSARKGFGASAMAAAGRLLATNPDMPRVCAWGMWSPRWGGSAAAVDDLLARAGCPWGDFDAALLRRLLLALHAAGEALPGAWLGALLLECGPLSPGALRVRWDAALGWPEAHGAEVLRRCGLTEPVEDEPLRPVRARRVEHEPPALPGQMAMGV